ncbi:mechanosensitive ion channel domain-containing protein, partial [Rhizobium leguminosarum]|uniref:mechanosensitive ion channel domain-containing protein n=1 Tax=Rhizobium leguminosarum TaxID=384 RepID=UPI003F9CC394
LYVAGGIHHFFVIVPLTEAIEARVIPFAKWVLVLGSMFQIVAGILLMFGLFVAVGFGAQTIVKDVISGMFYLWEDAFRIGEYIESGSHKG